MPEYDIHGSFHAVIEAENDDEARKILESISFRNIDYDIEVWDKYS